MKVNWNVWGKSGARWVGLSVFSLGLVLPGQALNAQASSSQDGSPATSGAPAPPARAVRLSSVEGRVQILQGNQTIADPAVANAPLFEGSQVVTMDDGRAEIQFEEGSVARISPNSSVTLTLLKPDGGVAGTQITVDSGLGYFELQSGAEPAHIQVRFGDSSVTSSGFTVLRVNLDNPPGELAVFSGNAHFESGSAVSLDLHGGESVQLGASGSSAYNLAESIEPDSWDSWNSDRDQVLNSEASSRTPATNSFANSQNPAWSDLDSNGNWYDVPGQGYVWSPYDASTPGWDPYGNGYWMWNPRFGYMWVSGDSWGYMPFNCGMWSFYGGFGWGWAPGAGACMPWWGSGFYGLNIGYSPFGYLPPRFPHRPSPRSPVRPGERIRPYPLIAVNKRPPSVGPASPNRDRNVSATIAGHVVMPLRPLSPRPVYDRTASTYGNRNAAGVPGGNVPGVNVPGAQGTVARPVVGSVHPGAAPRPVGATPHASAPSHASSPAPASHSSSGGGGGSAPHGGGGGGGGSHH